jgi:iron complex outermembrane receptor protein
MAPFTQRIPKKLALELLQMKSILLKRNTLFITIALALSANINAQQNESDGEEIRTLEEVIVTAQKREQSLQDVPVTVSAFSGDFIEQTGVKDIRDIAGLTPNMSIKTRSETETTVFMRGIGSLAPGIGADPAVGIFIDGMTASRGTNATAAFFDVERVEVVKGPQGTLFGRNASAGAIAIITNKAELDNNYGHVMLGVGDQGQFRGQFVGNMSAGENWAFRIGGNYNTRDGLYENTFTGQDLLDQNTGNLRLAATGIVSDSWSMDFMVEAVNAKSNDAIFTDADVFEKKVSQNKAPRKQELDSTRAIWTNKWDFDNDMVLTSITGYYDHDAWVTPVDADEIDFPVATFIEPQTNKTWSQELRLNGSTERMDWFVGASYLSEKLGFDTDFNYEEGVVLDLLAGLGELCLDPELPECTYQSETPFGENDVTSTAIYGDLTFALSDTVGLTVGARYTKDKKKMFYDNPPTDGILGVLDIQVLGPISDGHVYASDSWSSFDPRIALDWDFSESTTLFINVASGYKSGGLNRQVYPLLPEEQNLKPFDEETVMSYEIGTKSKFMDGRASLNASVFYNDYKDFQLETFVNPVPEVFNIGDVRSSGIELEGQIMATDNLQLAATYAYLDSEMKNSLDPEIEGKRTPNAPKHSGSAQAHYFIDTESGEWKLSGTWMYSSSYWFDVFNTLDQPSYNLFNLRAGYEADSEKWGVAGFIDNATDEEYYTDRFNFLDLANKRAAGRLYRVEFTYRF